MQRMNLGLQILLSCFCLVRTGFHLVPFSDEGCEGLEHLASAQGRVRIIGTASSQGPSKLRMDGIDLGFQCVELLRCDRGDSTERSRMSSVAIHASIRSWSLLDVHAPRSGLAVHRLL